VVVFHHPHLMPSLLLLLPLMMFMVVAVLVVVVVVVLVAVLVVVGENYLSVPLGLAAKLVAIVKVFIFRRQLTTPLAATHRHHHLLQPNQPLHSLHHLPLHPQTSYHHSSIQLRVTFTRSSMISPTPHNRRTLPKR
jgi:hypothetical protein